MSVFYKVVVNGGDVYKSSSITSASDEFDRLRKLMLAEKLPVPVALEQVIEAGTTSWPVAP